MYIYGYLTNILTFSGELNLSTKLLTELSLSLIF